MLHTINKFGNETTECIKIKLPANYDKYISYAINTCARIFLLSYVAGSSKTIPMFNHCGIVIAHSFFLPTLSTERQSEPPDSDLALIWGMALITEITKLKREPFKFSHEYNVVYFGSEPS